MSDLKVDNMYYFELMDRSHIILCNVDDFLIQNPATKLNKSIAEKLDKIGELLSEVYSEAGAIYFKNLEENESNG